MASAFTYQFSGSTAETFITDVPKLPFNTRIPPFSLKGFLVPAIIASSLLCVTVLVYLKLLFSMSGKSVYFSSPSPIIVLTSLCSKSLFKSSFIKMVMPPAL